jgi:protoporphyrinogen oxidase
VKAVVIGGGVAGMTSAYRLMEQGHDVALYEASPFLGGLVRTFEVGGTRLEAYYHHIFSSDTTIIRLIDELGLKASCSGSSRRSAGTTRAAYTTSSRRSTCCASAPYRCSTACGWD